MRFYAIIIILFFGVSSTVSSQHQEQVQQVQQVQSEEQTEQIGEKKSQSSHDNVHSHFRLALLLGHSIVPVDEVGTRTTIPSWGIDIEFWLNHKFGIGLHNDLEMMTFVIERGENEEALVREYPKVFTLDLLYSPISDLVLIGGIGKEFEINENYFLYRLGIEYEIPISKRWDICPSFAYDSRKDAFNTCTIMLGIGHKFLH